MAASDPPTFLDAVEKLKVRFGAEEIALVGDRGMIKSLFILIQILQRRIQVILVELSHLQDLSHRMVLTPTSGRQAAALMPHSSINQIEGQTLLTGGLADSPDDSQLTSQGVQRGQ